jgi:phage tail protein X
MPFATFEGEKSVAEIADRLFARMTPKQRETAVTALIRANPGLERIEALRPGVMLMVPDIPALRPKATASNESPDRQVLEELERATRSYAERVIARQDADIAEVKNQTAALESPRFTKAISRSEELIALAKEAGAALDLRAKAASDRRKAVEAASNRISADLEEALKRR